MDKKQRRCEEVYDMVEIIGEGTFSSVVLANHNDTQEPYAVKIIDKARIESTKQLLRVYNEIALHRQAHHPYVVSYVEHYETDIDVCIVMELCRGGELFDRIVEKKYYKENEARTSLQQILQGVQYLHSIGIVHRDIKPENLLYSSRDDDAVIKIGDFGLAKKLDDHSKSGRALLKASLSGTPAYCAPERLKEDVESKAVDMWSVGCILYFLLYGVPPFYSEKEDEAENEDEIFDSVLEGNVTFPENRNISNEAKDLIMRLLEKDPRHRLTADESLVHPWFHDDKYASSETESKFSNTSSNVTERKLLKNSINRACDVHQDSHESDEATEMDDTE